MAGIPRKRDQAPSLEEQIADAEIRALLAEDAIVIDPESGNPIVKLPWADLLQELYGAWPEKSPERDQVESVLKWIARGLYHEEAFRRSGLRPTMGQAWSRLAAKGDPKWVVIKELLDRADAVAEAQALTVLERASRKDWRAAAWFLERKYPQKWGTGAMRMPHVHALTTKDPRYNGSAPPAQLLESREHEPEQAPLLPPLPPSEFDDAPKISEPVAPEVIPSTPEVQPAPELNPEADDPEDLASLFDQIEEL